jgi:hypothetical protein
VILHQPAASSGIKRSHFQKLSRVLESSPHIAPLIKDLQIVDDGPHPVLSEWRTLSGMLPLFVLKRISIRCTKAPLDWDRIHREFKASLQGVFASPRLEDIQLQGVLISAPQECALFHIFMNAHADLQHLSFSYKHRKSDESSLLIPPVWAPKLRSLVIDTSHVKGLLRGLCSPAMDYSRLRTLVLSGFTDSDIKELLFAIKDRNVLEHLKIGYPGSNGWETSIYPKQTSVLIFQQAIPTLVSMASDFCPTCAQFIFTDLTDPTSLSSALGIAQRMHP